MHSTRLTHILMMALSVTSVTGVAWLDNDHSGAVGQLEARQRDPLSLGDLDPTGSDTAATPSSSDAPASSTDEPDSSTPPPTSSDEPTPTPSSSDNTTPTPTDTPSSTNGPSSTAGPTTSHSVSSTPTPTQSTTNGGGGDDNNTSSTDGPATTVPPITSTFTTVYTTTDAAGRPVTTSSSSIVVSTPTSAPDDQNQNTGMPQETRNTIIGVCVGVGGAIVLAAAGVLFWRLRSKKRSQEENEELVSYGDGFGGPGTAEKTEPSGSTATRSPFQSTLESYHAPTQTNAASNF